MIGLRLNSRNPPTHVIFLGAGASQTSGYPLGNIPGGNKGAGVLRVQTNIEWDKDRGKEPKRDKKDFPWFWNGSEFTGDRVNDVHLTKDQKERARE